MVVEISKSPWKERMISESEEEINLEWRDNCRRRESGEKRENEKRGLAESQVPLPHPTRRSAAQPEYAQVPPAHAGQALTASNRSPAAYRLRFIAASAVAHGAEDPHCPRPSPPTTPAYASPESRKHPPAPPLAAHAVKLSQSIQFQNSKSTGLDSTMISSPKQAASSASG
nr:hypothetical protein Iba_chr06bCG9910 [Ipomoea batatas]